VPTEFGQVRVMGLVIFPSLSEPGCISRVYCLPRVRVCVRTRLKK